MQQKCENITWQGEPPQNTNNSMDQSQQSIKHTKNVPFCSVIPSHCGDPARDMPKNPKPYETESSLLLSGGVAAGRPPRPG